MHQLNAHTDTDTDTYRHTQTDTHRHRILHIRYINNRSILGLNLRVYIIGLIFSPYHIFISPIYIDGLSD